MVARVRELRAAYRPPDFAHVQNADAAVFLCAVDHKTGYRRAHRVGGGEPVSGSELMWDVALAAARERPGLLTAHALADVTADEVAEIFRVGDETVADSARRAELWRDLARGLERGYGGEASTLLGAAGGRLGGDDGLLARLAAFEAYSDPLAKKAQLFAKICHRRGWLEVSDPQSWQVSADNVLMRLALRSGLVQPGALSVDGTPIDLRKVTIPTYVQAGREDHIAPPQSVWKITHHFQGPMRFVLAGSGHIAGVVNPPEAQKYQYWTNEAKVDRLEEFIAGATETKGSWWPDWIRWIEERSPEKVLAAGVREPGKGRLKAIEDAPGSYVKAR